MKILDLRRSPGTPGTAVLTDAYLVRRQTDGGNGLISIYGTNGTLEGRCLTHPGAAHEFGPIESRHMAVNCAIGVDLAALAPGSVMRVVNEVTYTGAYDRVPVEQFETHVDRPTRMLTIILLLRDGHPSVDVAGYVQVGRRHERRSDGGSGPLLIGDGTVAYWRLVPEKGEWLPPEARFMIEWRWRPASVERTPPRPAVAGEGA
ncbi:MAG: hypothetical protein FWJ90_20110 [Actinomadura sp.]